MKRIGYARVSTVDQKLNLQRDALKAAGCDLILVDQVSGTRAKRPGLDKALAKLGPDVVLVVWRLDRLGRSLSHLVEVLKHIQAKGAGFISLTEAIDTTNAGGRLVFHMMAALAEFERALIVERTQAGPPQEADGEAGQARACLAGRWRNRTRGVADPGGVSGDAVSGSGGWVTGSVRLPRRPGPWLSVLMIALNTGEARCSSRRTAAQGSWERKRRVVP